MLRFWRAFLLILAISLGTAASGQTAKPPQVAALAVDRSKGFIYGWAYDQPTREAAEAAALEEVAKRGGRGSVVLVWSGSGCGAYRTLDSSKGNAYGWGLASTREAADAIAMREIAKRTTKVAFANVWACNSDKTQAFEPIFVDRNLPSVVIGQQEWLATNLNVDRFRNGDPIPHFTDFDQFWKEGIAGRPASFCYPSLPCEETGRYYNLVAVLDPRGLAPAGWRVPVWSDFAQLIDYLGGGRAAGNRLRSPDGWPSWTPPVGSPSGFNAQPVGNTATEPPRFAKEWAENAVSYTSFWTSTPRGYQDVRDTLHITSGENYDNAEKGGWGYERGNPVRLIRVPMEAGAVDRGGAGYPAPKPVPAPKPAPAAKPAPGAKPAAPAPKAAAQPTTPPTPSAAEQRAAADQAEVERLNAEARADADRQLQEVTAMKAKAKADEEAFEKASAAHRAAVAKAEAEAAEYAKAKAAADAQAAEYARQKAAYEEAMRKYREATKPK